ncbi:MAG: ABC transporter permease [Limnochordales bacterium]|nr:ABC transporter permease [Bacillota bacterium]
MSERVFAAGAEAVAEREYRSQSPAVLAWKRLRKDRVSLFGLGLVVLLVLVAVFAPWIAPYDPINDYNLRNRLQPPSKDHWLGTDSSGRDVFSRIVYGARLSLGVGLTSRIVTLILGVGLGALAGYFAGTWIDLLIMRLAEIVDALPSLFVAIGVAVALGPGLYTIFIALGLVGWADMARLIRGQVLQYRNQEFVEAARAMGSSNARILFRHILPQVTAPIIITLTMGVAGAIMAETTLSFLGLGAQPPAPSWGSMMNYARAHIYQAPHLVFAPGLAIFITVYAFNLLGDGLRDALDPKAK